MRQPGNTSGSNNNSGTTTTKKLKNKISPLGEFKMTFTVDGTGIAGNIAIFPGPCPGLIAAQRAVTVPDQQHVILTSTVNGTGNAAGYADFKNYISLVGMHLKYVRITTNQVADFTGSLFFGEVAPNGILNPQEIPLTPYRTNSGGTYDNVLEIRDQEWITTKNFYMYITGIGLSNSFVMNWGIGGLTDVAEISELN